jgi:uncharacterized protein YdhG (YjbR/CyaY superfamily)
MRGGQKAPRSIDEYIATFPDDVQVLLTRIRKTVRKAAPHAEETISYKMPTFSLEGFLVSFAAYRKHIGLYPAPSGSERFNRELSAYRAAKSTVRFPLDKPIPYDLMGQIVKLRVKENLKKAQTRRKNREKKVGRR